jgi:hypothetical protein
MTAAEFEGAGLAKLSPTELAALETWLATQVETAVERAEADLKRRTEASVPQVIESTISGEFEGWEGDTVFVLDNGQVWQQIDGSYHYHYAYRPDVLLVRASAGWLMIVEDVEERVEVTRIR